MRVYIILLTIILMSCGKRDKEPVVKQGVGNIIVDAPVRGQIGQGFSSVEVTPLANGGAYIQVDDILYYGEGDKLFPVKVDTSNFNIKDTSISAKKIVWSFWQKERQRVKELKAELAERPPAPDYYEDYSEGYEEPLY